MSLYGTNETRPLCLSFVWCPPKGGNLKIQTHHLKAGKMKIHQPVLENPGYSQYQSKNHRVLYLKDSYELFRTSICHLNLTTLSWEAQFVVIFMSSSNRQLGAISGSKKLFLENGYDLSSIYKYALTINAMHVALVANAPHCEHGLSEGNLAVQDFKYALSKLGIRLIDLIEVKSDLSFQSLINKL